MKQSQNERVKRTVRTMLYLLQHGASISELARFTNAKESTIHRDIRLLRDAGIEITCSKGTYRIPQLPDLSKLDDEDDPRLDTFRNTIFRKWYKTETRDNYWLVVRADKPDPKGTRIGPVQITGKSWYPRAVELARERNLAILEKRRKIVAQMLNQGWSHDEIIAFKEQALKDARRELGDENYQEQEI